MASVALLLAGSTGLNGNVGWYDEQLSVQRVVMGLNVSLFGYGVIRITNDVVTTWGTGTCPASDCLRLSFPFGLLLQKKYRTKHTQQNTRFPCEMRGRLLLVCCVLGWVYG